MVKKYSKRTYKRKNKISRKRKSKRNHSRYKKKKTKKKKRVKNIKAGMKPVQPPPVSLEPEPAPADPELEPGPEPAPAVPELEPGPEPAPAVPELEPGPEPAPADPELEPGPEPGSAEKERRAAEIKAEGYRTSWGVMPSGYKITWENIAHNSLEKIQQQINECGNVPVFVLIVSNHGTMEGALAGASEKRPPGWSSSSEKNVLPQNMSLVFNILPDYSTSKGWPNSHKRNFIKEDLILHALSNHIKNVPEDLDLLFGGDGCLTESGESLNAELTKTLHNEYDVYSGLVNKISDETDTATLISEGYVGGETVKSYGILHKLQVYKEGEPYHNQSFMSSKKIDKDKLGVVFKFETTDGYKYLYHNLKKGGLNFKNHRGNELDCIKLSNILSHIEPLIETGKQFIITYNSCRGKATRTQKEEGREHGNSDSVDCYIKKFPPIQQKRIKKTIKDLGYENMIDFYEFLRDKEYLDAFVKLEGVEIIGFFRDLATKEGITDRWLDLVNKERLNPPPRPATRRPRFPLLAATLLPATRSTQQEDPFFVGEPPEPEND